MDISSLIAQVLLLLTFGKMLAFGFAGQEERKCKYLRVEKLLKIRCFDMNLKEVPQYLKTSVEILDLSFNRIRSLKRNSFEKYGSIKFLLLYENMIQNVEPGTFEQLTSLQEIDLSSNGLLTIPLEIFQLPSLRNLYVDSNDIVRDLETDLQSLERPIRAPLEYLNVANCGLKDLPDLGVLPNLWHINASTNPLTELSIDKFANMCQLKSIDLTRTSLSQCTCQQVNNHFHYLGVKTTFVPVCMETLDISLCPLPYNETIESEAYRTCKNTQARAEARSQWMFASGCFGGIFIVILLVWYWLHRRRKRRQKKLKAAAMSRKNFVISPKNAINNRQEDELLRCDNA